MVHKELLYDVIIENISEVYDPKDPNMKLSPSTTYAVKPICAPDIIDYSVTPDDTLRAQDEDATLKKIRGVVRNDTDADFIKKKGMINRLILEMEKVHTINCSEEIRDESPSLSDVRTPRCRH